MILVHLASSWPDVLAHSRTAAEVTLSAWAQISDDRLRQYGDAVLGVYQKEVVTAFDITGWSRTREGRVVFEGNPSRRWAHLIGTPNPGKPWVRGQARPVQYLDTAILASGAVPVEDAASGRRAVVDDFILTVDAEGSATLVVPSGRRVTVITTPVS
ncbi:hypothetical protein [Streptomyces sp. KHY 26]|uniref:hypothetical protein n=1 Tax=Streptomyces sp. KHY 26 TaxID=3097359 RepID=UPI00376F22F2